jgi:hypothetical protein
MKLISTFALLSTIALVGGTSLRRRALGNQDASLRTVRVERGYTQATQAGVSVQRGIQATMHYNYQYNGITWQDIKTATENYIATQHGEQKSKSESAFVNGHAGVSGFWSFLGFNVGASGGWNSASSSNTVSGEQASHLDSLFTNIGSSAKQDITLTGDITAVGQSYIPTEGFVFVRVISFHFDDGRTFTAVDTSGAPNSAIAATSNGDTSSLTTTSAPPAQLNIVPASRQLFLGKGPPAVFLRVLQTAQTVHEECATEIAKWQRTHGANVLSTRVLQTEHEECAWEIAKWRSTHPLPTPSTPSTPTKRIVENVYRYL